MDIPRKSRKLRRIEICVIIVIITLGAIAAITIGLSPLESVAPTIERKTQLIDSVKRGDTILGVCSVCTFAAKDMHTVPARFSGHATHILIQPGTYVKPNTVILEFRNPNSQLNWLNAQSQFSSVLARYDAQKAGLQSQLLGLEAGLALTKADVNDTKLRFEVDRKQYDDRLILKLQMTVLEGNITMDLSLDGELPKGAQLDLPMVGTIEIEQLLDMLYVGRPVLVSADSQVELFRLIEDGRFTVRVSVQFGKTLVSTLQCLDWGRAA
jgi:hypothetical protein